MFKTALQEQLLPGENLWEKWDFAQNVGYDAIELRAKGDLHFAARLPELKQALKDGAVMPTVSVDMLYFFGAFDDDLRLDALEQVKSHLTVIAEIGGLGARTPASYGMFSRRLSPFEPPRTEEQDREVLLSGLAELGEHARREGVTLFLAPLNRYEDHMVNRLEQAADLIRETGLDAIRIGIDSFHMNVEESDPAAAILANADYIGHAHVSDSNRFQPGAGHLDWPAWLGALHTIGYDGYLAAACRLTGEPFDAVRSIPDFLKRSGA
jgi:sugar phosphate isomerase/epimerase